MSYFVSRGELLEEIAKAVDAVFSAVGRLFSDKDDEFNRKLKELESNFLLLINTVGQRSHQSKNMYGLAPVHHKKRSKKMEEEPRAIRPFEEVLDEVVHNILESGDHELIILIDELEKSAKEEMELKEELKSKLRQIFKGGMPFLKKEEVGKAEKKEEEEIKD